MISVLYFLCTAAAIIIGLRLIMGASTRPTERMKADRLLRACVGALGATLMATGFMLTYLKLGGFDPLAWMPGEVLLFFAVYMLPLFLVSVVALYLRFSSGRD